MNPKMKDQSEIELLKKENEKLKLELQTFKEQNQNLSSISKKFEQLFNNITDAVYYFKIDINGISGKFIEINRIAYERLGYTKNEMLNLSPFEIDIHENKEVQEILQKISNNETTTFETTHVCKDGTRIPVENNTHTLDAKDGKFILSVCRDISDRKEAEDSLHRLESFYNHSSEGIAIFDLSGRILQANQAFEVIFGYMEHEVKGKRLPVTPGFSMQEAEYLLRETLKGNNTKQFETIKQRKNGDYITVSITMSPIRDKNTGKINAMAGIVRDITQQKSVMIQLESFIQNNIDSILIFDKREKLLRVNSAFENVFGWGAEELLGLSIKEMPIIPKEKRQEVVDFTQSIKADKGIRGCESYRIKKDGSRVDVLLTTFSVKNDLNKNIWLVVILKDITEKKRAEKLLIDSEKLSVAGELAASIAHEIRNPITAIKGFLQLMDKKTENQSYFEIIDSEMNRIELILNELLLLAKPQVIKLEEKNICIPLEQSIALLSAQANMNSVVVKNDYEPDDYILLCEENRLKQVFINVIKNAIDAMPNGGQLTIQLRKLDEIGKLLIRFIDQGCGIPQNVLLRIGEPFYTTKEKGTGLGFMVCKSIIEDHNGEINVSSEVNKGTTVEITLPLPPIL
ncbi:PAS domain-containing sensor histidine kinase [Ammoniphilus sp. CFH 90114]|uniref:PAS domain-containing sensor histidine kinase n=1 Tax=Ammoniphilus sp. CFH 90114 TaxID=2493665 RepID=UPI00100E19BB|nr:PAS domain-containing sensor histidine kinase [Ammoniphilus sp. CFH 90114]RXT07139.1 PAS domain-containing sensor histidine kinase [Ammoniphilus sp. CFH 90114]